MFYMKKLFLVLISLAVVFSCKPENGGNSGENPSSGAKATVVRLGSYSMLFEAISPEAQTVKVYADGDWTVQAPEWVSVSPDHGSGTVTVTVSVLDNESKEGRTAEVVFAPDLVSTTNRLTVQQKGDNKVRISTGQALAEWLAGLTEESLDEAYLDADIDMNGIEFTYSEGSAKGFSGVLDGHGHVIKNLSGTGPLFRVNKGTLKNIVIDESCSFEPDTLVFGVLASRNEGIIEDCINKASVTRRIAPTTSKSNLIAGIVGMSVAKDENVVNLTGCKNYGNVSILVNDDGKFTSQGVAGVVAYALDEVVSCENYGEITLSGGYHTNRACPARKPDEPDNIEAGEFYSKKVGSSVGGVVAYAIGPLDKCRNEGKVSWIETKVEDQNTSPARMFAGGVAGCYWGAVSDCTNSGAFEIKVLTSDKSDFSGQNHQLCAGGVLGGVNNPSDDAPSKNRGVSVTGCSNSGAITADVYTTKDWAHLGGVIGWPASENDNTNPSNWGVMSSCTNSGDITLSGLGQVRVGGLVGVTPYMENCSNTGKITILGAEDYAEIGGIAGHHWGFAQTIKNCSSHGDIESAAKLDVGGFFGWVGNSSKSGQSASVEGGSFSGNITCGAGSEAGMLVGGFAKNQINATIGTSTAPVEVSGSLNGTVITTGNAANLLWGVQFDETAQSFNYVIK